jgi:cytochrome o ubiquinol oxidase subunit 2
VGENRNMKAKLNFLIPAGVLLVFIAVLVVLVRGHTIEIMAPQGLLASKERSLIIVSAVLALLVLLPVYVMIFLFAWRYNEKHQHSKYTPDWDNNRILESIWWGVPIAIIGVLIVITWQSSHALDPFKPISSNQPSLHIQVVAMQYKWLFIYPEEHIASVNYLQIPVGRPVAFTITSDAPMNSFWVPQLGGQVYAMAGMNTQLHLRADKSGVFNGSSANLSGEGFADMKFKVAAVSPSDYAKWVRTVHSSPDSLTHDTYDELAIPGKVTKQQYYGSVDDGLYDTVVMKYMMPETHTHSHDSMMSMPGMNMNEVSNHAR